MLCHPVKLHYKTGLRDDIVVFNPPVLHTMRNNEIKTFFKSLDTYVETETLLVNTDTY